MKKKILVADDSRSLLQYTMDVLEHAGFESLGAPDESTGLELIEDQAAQDWDNTPAPNC